MQAQSQKVVYLVRHGQSVDNAAPVFQSTISPLSPKGKQQAKQIADRASKLSFEALVASPLQRAKETAEVIAAATGKPVDFSELFVERIKPTSISGKPWDDPVARATWRDWEESLYTSGLRVEDGENLDDGISRADQALAYLLERPEQSMLVVSHGYFIRTMVARVLLGNRLNGELLRRFQMLASMENTSITILQYKDAYEEDPSWRLWTYNDHAHFAD